MPVETFQSLNTEGCMCCAPLLSGKVPGLEVQDISHPDMQQAIAAIRSAGKAEEGQVASQDIGVKRLRKLTGAVSQSPLLYSLYNSRITPILQVLLEILGPGWSLCQSSECFLYDRTTADQKIHTDGEEGCVLSLNLLIAKSLDSTVELNFVKGSHKMMCDISLKNPKLHAVDIGEDDFDYRKLIVSLDNPLEVSKLPYSDGYPILSWQHLLHGGVSTSGKEVIKYHCMVYYGIKPKPDVLKSHSPEFVEVFESVLNHKVY
jgi:hypothetical protein